MTIPGLVFCGFVLSLPLLSFLDEPTHSIEVMPERFPLPEIARRFINELFVVQSVGRYFVLLYK